MLHYPSLKIFNYTAYNFAAAVTVFIQELRGLTARSTAYRDKVCTKLATQRSNLLHNAYKKVNVLYPVSNCIYLLKPTHSKPTHTYAYKPTRISLLIVISVCVLIHITNAFIVSNIKFIVTYALNP
ncbi:hypothetical protein K504DRAFT_453997 [Pleomassaria siparia CBS 279.74]|uniref:Uncharacterized protein n=1 Tax=Pleomassaria siparia CBS 279.74 TaxID=1314801 RepID=A0A6G1KDR9_9PLEO|nr:hypothetical protein K504DRAFT_453997 [Pleomassaria siparia CBS 279.74]